MRQVQKVATSSRYQDHVYRLIPVSMYPEIIWPYGFAVHTAKSLLGVEVDIYRRTGEKIETEIPTDSGLVNQLGEPMTVVEVKHIYQYHYSRKLDSPALTRAMQLKKEKSNE